MDPLAHSFNVESYKQIRAETGVLLARIENLFRYSLLAIASVFAWLVTQAFGLTSGSKTCLKLPAEVLHDAWFIPAAFVLLSGLVALATHIRVLQMGKFLGMCERALGLAELSWESFLAPKPPLFTTTTIISWLLMFGVAVYGGSVGTRLLEQDHPSCTQPETK